MRYQKDFDYVNVTTSNKDAGAVHSFAAGFVSLHGFFKYNSSDKFE